MKDRTKKQNKAIVEEGLKRFDIAHEAWKDVFDDALEDLRFVDEEGAQWDRQATIYRKGRPVMTFDKVSGAVDQVVGDHLQNRPGIKVRGAEDDDQDTAEIYEGLIRQIEQRGDKAYKTGFKFAAKGGYGAWRVRHDYISDDSMDQDIILHEVKNPFNILIDPIIQTESIEKAKWGFAFEDMPKEEFEIEWPKAKSDGSGFEGTGTSRSWITEDKVRVAEYYRLITEDFTIYQLSTGEVVEAEEFDPVRDEWEEGKPDEDGNLQQITVERERVVHGMRLECYKMTGLEILEEVECIGKYVPLVAVFGKNTNIAGKFISRGIVRKAKDAQRLYNYERSAYIEVVALQPKAPYLATAKMILGNEEKWQTLNTNNEPVLFYTADEGLRPTREAPPQVSSGLVQGLQISSDDIKSATGQFNASLGDRSNETSGKAIRERKMEGDTATYEYTDELIEAMKYTGMIYVDLIPQVYDSTRMIRILGEDDAEDVKEINRPTLDQQSGEVVTLNDLSRGKYDIKITAGPSYSTRRTETAEQLSQVMAQNPELGQLISDIWLKSLDLVGADEAVKRIRKLLIQKGIVEPTDEEQQEAQENVDPEQAQQKQQQEQLQQMVQKIEMGLKELELKGAEAEVGKTQSETALNKAKIIDLQPEGTSPDEQAKVRETNSKTDLNRAKTGEIAKNMLDTGTPD